MDGDEIHNGMLVIQGETISAVGSHIVPPLLAQKVDAQGGTVTPGLIDVASLLGCSSPPGSSSGGSGQAVQRAEDAFDHYATLDFIEVFHHGVTAIYLSPGRSPGICGTGAILRLAPDPGRDPFLGIVLRSEAALAINLASTSQPVARLKTLAAVRKQFRDALEYRKVMEDYQEDVAEYQKQLKEWHASQEKKGVGKDQEENQGRTQESDTTKEGKTTPSRMAALEGKTADEKSPGEKKEPDKGKDGKPQKPQRPERKPDLDIVLKTLDRKLPVRILAHRSEDILNAIDLAEEFSFDWILEGASESHLVAKELAALKVPVIFGSLAQSSIRRDDIFRRSSMNSPQQLSEAGVPWFVGSGAENPANTRFIALDAQIAAARSGGGNPLEAVTARAADALGVGQQIGRLKPGFFADFVVWSGDPLDPATKVRRVYAGGRQVYRQPSDP
ncbi:MAG: amidohydrolase family protein [Pirellulales bacterium]|nr:amidohydrolase family protein [Pirellulales bacterium]